MPYKNCRVRCHLCGAERHRQHIDRHLYRIHQIGEWKPSFSAAPSRSATNAPSPEREMDDSEPSTRRLPVDHLTVVPVSVHQSWVPNERDGSSTVNRQLDVSADVLNSVNAQEVPSISVDSTTRNTSCQATPALSDQRNVVSRAQMVSCVRVSNNNSAEINQSSVVKPGNNIDAPISDDTLNWVIKDAVLCMLRREENNTLVSLRRYLLTRFPQIPDVCRDVVIIATFTTAQKVALSYLDTLHEDAAERYIWAKNYLHKWSHGLSASEPPPRYVPTVKTSENLSGDDRYSPVANYLLTKELPVTMASQKREFEREFDRVTDQIVGEQAKTVGDNLCAKGHSVTQTLVSVAENLMNLPTSNDLQNRSKSGLAEENMVTESTEVADSQCSKLDGVVLSMPDLSEFAPVVTNGVVQPVDVLLDGLYEDDPMDEGHATDSPILETFEGLLHVENVPDDMLEEINKPLLEIISPITSPVLSDSETEDNIEHVKDIDYSSSSVSPVKSVNVLKHSRSGQVQMHDLKSSRKHKSSNSVKENDKSQKNAAKVASVCKKVNREQRKDKRISEFKVPLRRRMDNFIRPDNRYRNEEQHFGRCVGLGRGYRPDYSSRYNEGPRQRPPSYNRAGYVPNLTPEQQAWLNQMPYG